MLTRKINGSSNFFLHRINVCKGNYAWPWSCQYSIDEDTVEVSQLICDFKLCRYDSAVLSGVTLMLFACIVWLKLVSYGHSSYDMRAIAKSIEKVQETPLKFFYYYL